MRPTGPEFPSRRARGVTLIELVVAIVLIGIIVATVAYFVFPVRQSQDIAARAELTDIAANAVQRIGRDVRLALPNSVRVNTSVPGSVFLEFLAVRTAGRYRADVGGVSGGTNCPNDDPALPPPGNDELTFDIVADSCFKTIGTVANAASITTSDWLVLNNYGPGFTGQDAYATSGTLNRAQIVSVDYTSESFRVRIQFTPTTFQRVLHDSPGKRFFVISGPVSYVCNTATGTITRYWGYPISATQPTSFAGASSALIATDVANCNFEYVPNVSPQVGLLTMQLTLAKALSGGQTESVSLYHSVHVSNVP
ncbi:MAG: type II secretion system protein [Betaproteobacteria bacterium]|nr:type II secretion system protein [Betaproteobacteria bacterium]